MAIVRSGFRVMGALAAGSLLLAGLAQAQQQRLPRQCRSEIVKLCGRDRSQIRTCLQQRYGELSESCSAALRARIEAMQGANGNARARGDMTASVAPQQEIAYGSDPLQRLDFYPAATGTKPAPLILFVHGGGWKRGDKRNATGAYKAPHLNALGYHFASINYRLVPQATVEQQAADVATALAALLKQADALGIDRQRVVLMGHSAGAHLVALVGTDPQYLQAAGLTYADLAGIVPLDGAGYDVPAQMGENQRLMGDTYEQAFGTDPVRQRALSPTFQAAAPNAPDWLILHVERPDSTRQSEGLGKALRAAGARVEVDGVPGRGLKGHMEINRDLGKPDYPATPLLDAWLKRLLG